MNGNKARTTILVSIIREEENPADDEIRSTFFKGDELTSPESQAIIWLREQQRDALDGQV